jgi:hypothetical protein
VRRRKKKGHPLLVGLLVGAALAFAATWLWRWSNSAPVVPTAVNVPLSTPAQIVTPPGSQAMPQHEDFSATERQKLEDILRKKNPGAQR